MASEEAGAQLNQQPEAAGKNDRVTVHACIAVKRMQVLAGAMVQTQRRRHSAATTEEPNGGQTGRHAADWTLRGGGFRLAERPA